MLEYVSTINDAARAIGMSDDEIVDLADATHALLLRIRARLHSQGKLAWFSGMGAANPFVSLAGANCSSGMRGYNRCGWWNIDVHDPKPVANGSACVAFLRERCGPKSGFAPPTLNVQLAAPFDDGAYRLSVAAFLLLRGKSAYFVTS